MPDRVRHRPLIVLVREGGATGPGWLPFPCRQECFGGSADGSGILVPAVLASSNAEVPAVLGGVVVVIIGLRSVFHWQDDYLRFSEAREAVEAERRLYYTGAEPYADPETRDQALAASATRIELREMGSWVQLAAPRADATINNVLPPRS